MTFRIHVPIAILGAALACLTCPAGLIAQAEENRGPRHRRVVGGTQSSYIQMSFLVQIVVKEPDTLPRSLCGGSLIRLQWVLTAAHCKHEEIPEIDYFAGIEKIDNELEMVKGLTRFKNGQTRRVMLFYTHKNYTKTLNDIALLKFPFDKTPTLSIVSLPQQEQKLDLTKIYKFCYSGGWGNTAENIMRFYDEETKSWKYNKEHQYKSTVVQVILPLISNAQCRRIWNWESSINFDVDPTQMCTLYYPGRKSLCRGDSGGPLICGKEQHGISSWSFSCGQPRTGADVFTRVDKYLDWINNTMDQFSNYTRELSAPNTKTQTTTAFQNVTIIVISIANLMLAKIL